ncbi:hypothetical protein RN001_001814 [Aquatica leii]|uniref:DUF4806 domain-containing protein n=1 Tax=Aquatica leii TaxID=1421715 RepID=A0AAN7QN35_9COLE|nr:hypothetical protein RN001_001814 [Aquatica leii]
MSWIVAHFQKDNTVEVVPKAWTPSPQCDWKIYSINILGAYDNYGKAQSKCNKTKDTDDLNSSASAGDDFGKGFREPEKKRNKEYLYDEEEDDYLDDLPSLPHTLVNIDNSNTVHNVKLNQKKCRVNAESTNTSFALPASELQEFINDFRQWMVKSTEFYKQHTRELHLIKLIVKENRETLEFLMKSGTKQGNLHNPPEENGIIKLITPLLPLKTEEDVKNLESIIDENDLNMQILVKDLSLLGGSTTKELVRSIMYHTFSNNVGALYSYEGQKGKKVFKTLLLQTTILKAVCRQSNEATDLEIVNGIKSWLVAAKFRGKKWKLLQSILFFT